MIWDWFESFFQDSDPGFANDSQDFAKILRGFVEKWEKILTFGNLKCQVLLKNARFLLEDSQKSQNWKIDSDLPLIRIPKLKIRWRLESLKLGFGLNTTDSLKLLRLPLMERQAIINVHAATAGADATWTFSRSEQETLPHHHGWVRLRFSDRKIVNHTTEMILWSMILKYFRIVRNTHYSVSMC